MNKLKDKVTKNQAQPSSSDENETEMKNYENFNPYPLEIPRDV
jgi:hypothetical protein